MTRLACLALLLLLSACSGGRSEPPAEFATFFNCGETLVTQDGELQAWPELLDWTRKSGGGAWGLEIHLEDAPAQAAFAENGFRAASHRLSYFFVAVPGVLDAIPTLRFDPEKRGWKDTAAEFRIGNRVVREPLPLKMDLGLSLEELERLMEAKGDLLIKVSSGNGRIDHSAVVARASIDRVEQELKAMHARVMAKRRDPEGRCYAD